MNRGANSSVFFLPDEKFDFDVSLSPGSSTGDDFEDEVFVGPVQHNEQCISVNVSSQVENSCVRSSWSPLSGDQLDAICVEAKKLANQIQCSERIQLETENVDPNRDKFQNNEFVEDSKTKLSLLCEQPPSVLSPIKRQTFLVHDSPLKLLPSAIQSYILKDRSSRASVGGPATCRPAGRTQRTQHPAPSRPTKSVSSSSVGPKTQSRVSLRGRSGVGVTAVLPSRPTAPKTQSITKNQTDKSRLQPPNKLSTSWRRSPTSSRNGSCEDLLSDSASVASDVSDSSVSSLGKRPVAPPPKGVRTRSGVKPPVDTSRRKTSSSSSSMSSFSSSFSQSPADKEKRSSSQTSLSSTTQSKPAQSQRNRRSVALSTAGRRSLSVQAGNPSNPAPLSRKPSNPAPLSRNPANPAPLSRKPSNPAPLSRKPSNPAPLSRNPSNPTPLRRPETSPAQTPVHRGSVTSVVKLHSNGPKPRPQALVLPTPNAALRGSSSPNVSKVLKPKRLISVQSADGLPQKPAPSSPTPSGGSSRALQLKARRPSALPTPLRSRPSGIPQATPKSQIRPVRAPPSPTGFPTSVSPTGSESPGSAEIPLIQPFNLEPEDPPTPEKSSQSKSSSTPDAVCLSQSEERNETELKPTVELVSKTQPEVLLLDLPTPALQPQEKLLIDLRNTPDLIRTRTGPSATELIDLSSPLIKWSPEEKRQADAPLINLSF